MQATDEVLTEVQGRLGVITLNRPKALNALNLSMVERLETVLVEWASDPAIDAVLIRGNGRAFCAGGDVRAIGAAPDPATREALGREFLRMEYRVDHRVHTFPKPIVASASGVVMGGGMGLAVHSTICIVTETTMMAMPETVLGLFPDVGATWFLNRCPGRIGVYLALTGARLGAADALWCGLATQFVPAERLDELVHDLIGLSALDCTVIDRLVADFSTTPPPGVLAERADAIDRLFGGARIEDIMHALEEASCDRWPAEMLAVLHRASPMSVRATFRRMQAAPGQTIETVLIDDYRMGVRIVGGHDFAEGVRAILIDKDNAPAWRPATLSETHDADVDPLLEPLLTLDGQRDADLTF